MLRNADLREFLAVAKREIPQIAETRLLANDTRYANISRDIEDEPGCVMLFAIIPSARSLNASEDNLRFSTALSFLVVKKFITGEGEEDYNAVFDLTQHCALELVRVLQRYKQQDLQPCLLEDMDMRSLTIVPVENYHQTNGYDVSIRSKTDL